MLVLLAALGEHMLMTVSPAKRTPQLETSNHTCSQPNRSPSFQYSNRHHIFLPTKRDSGRSIRTSCSRNENETSEDRRVE